MTELSAILDTVADSTTAWLIALAWLCVIFVPLEWANPAWPKQRRRRVGLAADLAFMGGQYLVWGALAVGVLAALGRAIAGDGVMPDSVEWLRDAYATQPLWVRAGQALVLGDLLMYAGHRLQHRYDLLWRFHAVHHTTEKLDFLAAHREHPLDGLYTQTLMNLPALVLGLSVSQVMGLVAFRSLWAIFIHSNARMSLGPLRLLLGAPELHHWHHSLDRDAGNYANLAPWIDWLFGTYHRPTGEPRRLGIEETHPRSYVRLLVWPFCRRNPKTWRRTDRRPPL